MSPSPETAPSTATRSDTISVRRDDLRRVVKQFIDSATWEAEREEFADWRDLWSVEFLASIERLIDASDL
jgi:hypothetical protein